MTAPILSAADLVELPDEDIEVPSWTSYEELRAEVQEGYRYGERPLYWLFALPNTIGCSDGATIVVQRDPTNRSTEFLARRAMPYERVVHTARLIVADEELERQSGRAAADVLDTIVRALCQEMDYVSSVRGNRPAGLDAVAEPPMDQQQVSAVDWYRQRHQDLQAVADRYQPRDQHYYLNPNLTS